MEIKNKVLIHNRFDIEVRDSVTNELKKSVVAYNIVLNQMYTRLCGGSTYFVNIHFGSGTGTLSPTRTSLFSHLGTKTAVDDTLIKSIPLSTWKRKIVLNPEEYVGNTISEVGVAFGATNTNLVTHSLLKDSEGNPISIVKTDTDVITIYATVFVTFDDSNPNLVYTGMPSSNALVNYLIGGAAAPTGAFSLNDTFLANARLGSTSNVTWTADTANKQRKTNVLRFGTTVGNGHVKFLEFANVFSLEFPNSSVFNGQSYEGVSLGVGDGIQDIFQIPSANIKDGSLQVKANGVLTTDFNVFERCGYRTRHQNALFGADSYVQRLAVSRNGKVLCVISQDIKYVQVFDRSSGSWIRRPNTPTLSNTPSIVIVSDDGNVVFAYLSNVIYVYRWNGSSWSTNTIATSANDMSVNGDGTILLVVFQYNGNAKVFDWNGTTWVLRSATLSLGSAYAYSCSISQDGSVIAVVNETAPLLHIFDWVADTWVKRPTVPNPYASFIGVSLSSDSQFLVVGPGGYSGSGKFRVYKWDGIGWNMYGDIVDTWLYNTSLRISDDGNTVVVAGVSAVNAVFVYNGVSWVKYLLDTSANTLVFASLDEIFTYHSTTLYKFTPFIFSGVEFNTPPAIGDVITADYIVDGVHKTDQYVIDVSMAIQFGEVV